MAIGETLVIKVATNNSFANYTLSLFRQLRRKLRYNYCYKPLPYL
jgi:hypothetical protein